MQKGKNALAKPTRSVFAVGTTLPGFLTTSLKALCRGAGESSNTKFFPLCPSASEAPQACEKCGSTRMRESAEHPLICDRCVAALAGEF